MSIKWERESNKMLVARASGRLARSEIGSFQADVTPILQAQRSVRLLVVLENFEGWEAGEGWEDTSFTDMNDQYLSRIAIVGDDKWRDQVLVFLLAGLRPVDISYFSSDQESAARAWIAEGLKVN